MALPEHTTRARQVAPQNKLFADALAAHPGDFLAQARVIVSAQRPAGLPENFQPKLMSSDYDRARREQQRIKQQQGARERERLRQTLEEERRRRLSERTRQEELRQKSNRELTRGEQTCRALEPEVNDREFNQALKDIRQQWSKGVTVAVHRLAHEPNVTLNDDGSTREDRSRVGIKVSYSHNDVVTHEITDFDGETYTVDRVERVKSELFFGVGYSGGVKSYFVEMVKGDGKATTAIPTDSPGARRAIFDRILAYADAIDPNTAIPEARARINSNTEARTTSSRTGEGISRRALLIRLGIAAGFIGGGTTIGLAIKHYADLHDTNAPLQDFCDGINTGDYQRAYNDLTPQLQQRMSYQDFMKMMRQYGTCSSYETWSGGNNYMFFMNVPGGQSQVEVTVQQTDQGVKIEKINFTP